MWHGHVKKKTVIDIQIILDNSNVYSHIIVWQARLMAIAIQKKRIRFHVGILFIITISSYVTFEKHVRVGRRAPLCATIFGAGIAY
jgi:hypothetical protein